MNKGLGNRGLTGKYLGMHAIIREYLRAPDSEWHGASAKTNTGFLPVTLVTLMIVHSSQCQELHHNRRLSQFCTRQTQMESERQLVAVHCFVNSLNLCIKDVTQKCELLRNCMDFIFQLLQLIRFSPKRLNLLRACATTFRCQKVSQVCLHHRDHFALHDGLFAILPL